MAKTKGRNLRGDALAEHAATLGIEVDAYRESDGSINETELQRRVSLEERYSSEFYFGRIVVACVAAFGICGIATWLAVHFLWRPY